MKYCINCGTEVPERAKFCPNCGTNINSQLTDNLLPAPKKKSRKFFNSSSIVFLIGVLIVVFLIVFFAINIKNNSYSTVADSGGTVSRLAPEGEKTKSALEKIVKLQKTQCPIDLGNGLVWVNTSIEGDFVVYDYSVDERVMPFSYLKKNQTKDVVIRLIQNNITMKDFVVVCISSNKGISYRYSCEDSGRTYRVDITPDDL